MSHDDKEKKLERPFWSFPRVRHPFLLFDNVDDDWDLQEFTNLSGLSVYEDDTHVFVEASLPGILSDEIDMVFDKGVLWIKAEKKSESEDKKKKFYRKALSTFSYRISVPGDIDDSKDPEALCKNGVLTVTFAKNQKKGPAKKIPIKVG